MHQFNSSVPDEIVKLTLLWHRGGNQFGFKEGTIYNSTLKILMQDKLVLSFNFDVSYGLIN